MPAVRVRVCLCPFHDCKNGVSKIDNKRNVYEIYCSSCLNNCGKERQRVKFANLDQGRGNPFYVG